MTINKVVPVLCLSLFFCLPFSVTLAQHTKGNFVKINLCNQDKTLRSQFIQEAEAKQYRVQRIEITGNVFIRDRIIREVMSFSEGYLFTGELLNKSLKNIGKIKEIKPIMLKNVRIMLDKKDAVVYLIFCVAEKKGIKRI